MRHNFIFQTVHRYTDPVLLIDEQCPGAPGWNELTEEMRADIRATLDYEPVELYVVNDDTVLMVDTISGDVLSRDTLSDYAAQSINYVKEGWES